MPFTSPIRRVSLFLVAAMFLVLGPASGLEAQTSQQETVIVSPESTEVHQLMVALELVQWGRAHQSAESLLSAANMLLLIPTTYVAMEKSEYSFLGKAEEPPDSAEAASNPIAVSALLAEAKILAKNQKLRHLSKHIAQRQKEASSMTLRGAVDGPKMHRARLGSSRAHSYEFTFAGKARASVAIVGDGETDLDIEVFDSHGKHIATSELPGDHESLSWVPKSASIYRVEIRNNGTTSNDYTLISN